jgi:hypothetical protein
LDDCPINFFHGREFLQRNEVVIKEKTVFGSTYKYAEPSQKGNWAFGGSILFTSNGIFSEFNTPIKLHDRNMDLE